VIDFFFKKRSPTKGHMEIYSDEYPWDDHTIMQTIRYWFSGYNLIASDPSPHGVYINKKKKRTDCVSI
jgi:hypothetical protein